METKVITTRQKKDAALAQPCEIESDLVRTFGKTAEIMIADIGMCDGLSSITYARIFPKAKIVGFEPREDNCVEAMKNFEEYGIKDRVEVYNVALSDCEGTTKFWQSEGQAEGVKDWDTGNKSSSLLVPKDHISEHPWCRFKQTYANIKKLDSYGFLIDFMHIDVQGAELKVLKGGINTLKNVKVIWAEVATVELYRDQPMKADVIAFLAQEGFRVIKDTCRTKYGDCLFVR